MDSQLKTKGKAKSSKNAKTDTSRTKTRKLLRNFGFHKSTDVRRVKRTLFHHFILTETPKNKYKKGGLAEKKNHMLNCCEEEI